MPLLPQPFEVSVKVEPPPSPPAGPPPADWDAASQQLRAVAQWIIGGVVATAAGVFAGSTLTKIGTLDLSENGWRLILAIAAVIDGFVAIALIMWRGIDVLAPTGVNLRLLAEAEDGSLFAKARAHLYQITAINYAKYPLKQLLDDFNSPAAREYLPVLYDPSSFCVTKARFDRLMRWMAVCVPLAIVGFGLFAWAANPPDKQVQEKGLVLKITL